MQSLKKLLKTKQEKLKVGEVVKKNSDDTYIVKIGARTFTIKNATRLTLKPKSQVIISNTDDGMFIVGENKFRTKQITEITTNG